MKKNYFDALGEVYADGGTGNKLLHEFYSRRTSGGHESQFARLAVYMEWKYGITSAKEIKTEHVYELLQLFREIGYKEVTLMGYISAYRMIFKHNGHLFSRSFLMPSNDSFLQWTKRVNAKIKNE